MNRHQNRQCQTVWTLTAVAGVILGLFTGLLVPSHAESLFRASAHHVERTGYVPNSFFTPPIPRAVGDIVTINLSESTTLSTNADLELEKTSVFNENTTNVLTQILRQVGLFDGEQRIPSATGIDNNASTVSAGSTERQTSLTDTITCQVMEVLPNGHLIVQGHKSSIFDKERQDLMITGIVNPFYLDRNSQIASSQVGNLQVMLNGKGIVSRGQNDGLWHKAMRWLY